MISHKQAFLAYLAQTSPTPLSLEVVKASGIYIRTADGKRYIDLISGIGVSNTGHRNTRVLNAIRKQLGKYMHTMVYGEYIQQPQIELARALAKTLPNQLNSTYLVNSGSEAIDGALKLARRYTGRKEFVACRNAYHGGTYGALSLMDNAFFTEPFKPGLEAVTFMQHNELDDVKCITSSTAAVIIEVVQGEGGYRPSTEEFLTAVRNRCTETGALLIIDEIQTGMGRTGTLFAFEQTSIVPDILCLAKAFGGGMPIGAFISSTEIMQSLQANPVLGHITTFGGHPVCAAAALENLRQLQTQGWIDEVAEKEKLFRSLLKHQNIMDISGRGLMLSIQLESHEAVQKVIHHLLDREIITDWFLHAEDRLRIAPPLIISKKQIKQVCHHLMAALDTLS
ncbi:MAG: aspartate aminotransferase family protein [Flavobacteriales bacterium]|nr:aspartate aminotransferase family protein [Bacteroidota bacterium]MCB9241731.1 aspartate aminotransferase family protein [Flavobacteriales bacterium]